MINTVKSDALYLLFVAACTLVPKVAGLSNCSVISDNNKLDCGFPGITKPLCIQKGCLWCKNTRQHVPWCFRVVKPSYNCTNFENSQKTDCHRDNFATRLKCEQRGCYWCESLIQGVPWCFHPNLTISTTEMSSETTTAPEISTSSKKKVSTTANSLEIPTPYATDKTVKTTDVSNSVFTTNIRTPSTALKAISLTTIKSDTTVKLKDTSTATASNLPKNKTKSTFPQQGTTKSSRQTCRTLKLGDFMQMMPPQCATVDQSTNNTCRINCNPGFKLIGPKSVMCTGGVWQPIPIFKCLDTTKPQITCPVNKTITLSINERTVPLEWDNPRPHDNSGQFLRIASSLENGNRRGVGNYEIWLTVVDSSGLSSWCSFTISVIPFKGAGRATISKGTPVSTTVIALSAVVAITGLGFMFTIVIYFYTSRVKRSRYGLAYRQYANDAYDTEH